MKSLQLLVYKPEEGAIQASCSTIETCEIRKPVLLHCMLPAMAIREVSGNQ